MNMLRCLLAGLLLSTSLFAQSNPGALQDQEAERLKLLRAVDQLDTMTTQVESIKSQQDAQKTAMDGLKTEVEALKSENAQLHTDLAALKTALEKLDSARAEEREVLLKKVGEIVAEATKARALKEEPPSHKPIEPAAESTPKSETSEPTSGYTYVVKKGDNLHDIAAAYQAQGVQVTVEDLRHANKLEKGSVIHTGQKLFIPKK